MRNNGGTDAEIEAAWRDAFADGLGWSHEEMDAFWNDPNYKFTADEALKFDQSWDAFFEMVKALGGGRFEARGPLTIKGKTVEVVTPFTYRDAPGGGMIDGNFSVKRLQVNIGEGAWKDTDTVADEVQIRYQLLLSRPQTPAKK